MILTYERAAGGEIAAGKGSAQWTPEGKPNAGSVSVSRGDGEDTPLSKSAYDSMRRVGVIFHYAKPGGTARDLSLLSQHNYNWDRSFLFYTVDCRNPAVSTVCLLSAIIERRKKK